jgi:hypothetical protein
MRSTCRYEGVNGTGKLVATRADASNFSHMLVEVRSDLLSEEGMGEFAIRSDLRNESREV